MFIYENIQFDIDLCGFVNLWLNCVEKNNVFNVEMICELIFVFDVVVVDGLLCFLLLCGCGKYFFVGVDLVWMQQVVGFDYEVNFGDVCELVELMYNLYGLKIFILVVVQGVVFGGVVGLVGCCDMVIGSEDVLFFLFEVCIGLVLVVISFFVVQVIGECVVCCYVFIVECFDGCQVCELGLFVECYLIVELDVQVEVWIVNLLLNSLQVICVSKDLLCEVGSGVLILVLCCYIESVIVCICVSVEGQEGLCVFFDKCKLSWQEY